MRVCQTLCKTGWYSASWCRIEKVALGKMVAMHCTDADGIYCRIRYIELKVR